MQISIFGGAIHWPILNPQGDLFALVYGNEWESDAKSREPTEHIVAALNLMHDMHELHQTAW